MKVLLVGKPRSGKTKAVEKLFNKPENPNYEPTKGADVYNYKNAKDKDIYIWDTAGNPNYAGLDDAYYIGAHICINFSNNRGFEDKVRRIVPDVKVYNYNKIKNLKEFLNKI